MQYISKITKIIDILNPIGSCNFELTFLKLVTTQHNNICIILRQISWYVSPKYPF